MANTRSCRTVKRGKHSSGSKASANSQPKKAGPGKAATAGVVLTVCSAASGASVQRKKGRRGKKICPECDAYVPIHSQRCQ